jgi:hypothetical protein
MLLRREVAFLPHLQIRVEINSREHLNQTKPPVTEDLESDGMA